MPHAIQTTTVGSYPVPNWLSGLPSEEAVILETEPRLPPRWIVVAWHRDRYHSPAAKAFVELARAYCSELDNAAEPVVKAVPA